MPNLFSVKSERNPQRPKMKITGYILLVLCVLSIFLLYPGYCECYIVETLCYLASSEVCSFSMFVLVCSCLGWTYCRLVGFSWNLSHAFTGFPTLWLSILEFSPHFPATLVAPNSALWFLGPETLWIFYCIFSSTAQCWFLTAVRRKAIKMGSSSCTIPFF